jgi:hypothetical protein
METQIRRRLIANKYFALEIRDCPIKIISLAASLGYNNVTIENFSQHRTTSDLVQATIQGNEMIKLNLKAYLLDFTIDRTNFFSLIDTWDAKGCYAIFHQSSLLKFKASDLSQIARYKALDNFGWNLELAIPDSASSGWGQITSPDETIIQLLLESLKNERGD